MHDDAGAIGQVRRTKIEHIAIRGDTEAQIGRGITKRDEYDGGPGTAGDLRHLTVDPDPPQLGDPTADLLAHHAHRPRRLGAGSFRRVGLGGGHDGQPTYHGGMSDPSTTRKRVLLAKPRGYCAGVDRAVQTVEEALSLYGAPIYVRKQIVHNKHVVATLEARGAIFVEENEEVPEGATVVFSAH